MDQDQEHFKENDLEEEEEEENPPQQDPLPSLKITEGTPTKRKPHQIQNERQS